MKAVTFDFYDTLVYHRAGTGRGRQFRDYLGAAGLGSNPWEHQVLYDVFEYYGEAYRPSLPDDDKLAFWIEFTRRLFARTNVRGREPVNPAEHAAAIREIMGPSCLALFDDAVEVLRELKAKGLRLGVVSDWQRGLEHFCTEIGIGDYLDVVVVSGDVGVQKPDPRLFRAARDRLPVRAAEILHVGDRLADVDGARAAGFQAALLVRDGDPPPTSARVIRSLRDLLAPPGAAGD